MTLTVKPIGEIKAQKGTYEIQVEREFLPALQGLDGFSHLMVVWWFSEFDTEEARSVLESPKPYTKGPEVMGVFATRSPLRPNPIALSVTEVLAIDHQQGIITIPWIDAHDQTPILDIKPYTPSSDRVETPSVPDWCSHWPMSYETSGDFSWEEEFEF